MSVTSVRHDSPHFFAHSPKSISSVNRASTSKMNRFLPFVALSAFARASAVQQPLQKVPDSQALVNTKPLISSEAIQDLISVKNLKKRAEELYEIAELSLDEYNHPTRVIGSPGKLRIRMPTLGARRLISSLYRTPWHC